MSLNLLATASPRKCRLLACACVRSMWWLVPHEVRAAVIEAEEMKPVAITPALEGQDITLEDGTTAQIYAEGQEAASLQDWVLPPAEQIDDTPDGPEYLDLVAEVLTPCEFSPEWRTSTVLALAQAMYDSRDFSAMPILADALQDAGCSDEVILAHCRGAGPHVRGCHVIDALTGRS